MAEPNLATDDDLQDVLQTQFQDRVRMADADYRNAMARGVPIGTAARQRGRALREAVAWRDAHGLPVAHAESPPLPVAAAYGAAAHTHNRPQRGQIGT